MILYSGYFSERVKFLFFIVEEQTAKYLPMKLINMWYVTPINLHKLTLLGCWITHSCRGNKDQIEELHQQQSWGIAVSFALKLFPIQYFFVFTVASYCSLNFEVCHTIAILMPPYTCVCKGCGLDYICLTTNFLRPNF